MKLITVSCAGVINRYTESEVTVEKLGNASLILVRHASTKITSGQVTITKLSKN